MLYVIGGPPRCGKTTLAEALARKLQIAYFSIDHITSVITPYISEERRKASFPLRTLLSQVKRDNDLLFEKYPPTEIVNAYFKQAETCWPGIMNFIHYAIQDEHDLILEGWQIIPKFLRDLEMTSKVQVRFLYKSNPQDILSGLRKCQSGKDWVLKNTKNENTFTRIAEMVSHFGRHIRDDAAASGFEAINMDTDFENKITELTMSLCSSAQ